MHDSVGDLDPLTGSWSWRCDSMLAFTEDGDGAASCRYRSIEAEPEQPTSIGLIGQTHIQHVRVRVESGVARVWME